MMLEKSAVKHYNTESEKYRKTFGKCLKILKYT